ncbi:MAG: oxidoreductase C-terminal domain-containing protein, partial [Propionibacteriaceae bacterium]|nr:oxidoreductase C-terminal domain-containing protein [Propionibacteriaceae bacterium]
HDMHRTKGVDLLAGGVVEITDRPDGVTVHLADHDPVDADVVIVGIGMVPDVAVAAASGATVDDGVIVDADQHTSIPGLYAIGDCCRVRNDDGTIRPRAEHWEAASADAARAAAAILGQPRPADQAPWFWSDRHGHHVEVVGDLRAGSPVVRGTFGEPPFAVLSLADGVVVGAASVDEPQTVRAARRLIDRRTPVSADELASGDLRKLARKKG